MNLLYYCKIFSHYYALSAQIQECMMQFCQKLQNKKDELQISQKELCGILYEVPQRTLQSWLQGDKEPPMYVQNLVLFKLSSSETVAI
ncbi:MAG: hypothetical protein RPS47_14800 [Colwellia sp.]|jgi:hypothetical protein